MLPKILLLRRLLHFFYVLLSVVQILSVENPCSCSVIYYHEAADGVVSVLVAASVAAAFVAAAFVVAAAEKA